MRPGAVFACPRPRRAGSRTRPAPGPAPARSYFPILYLSYYGPAPVHPQRPAQRAARSGPHPGRRSRRNSTGPYRTRSRRLTSNPTAFRRGAHLAVAPFVQHDPEMAMAARCSIAVGVLPGDAIEARRPIVELHTREQLADHSRLRPAARRPSAVPGDHCGSSLLRRACTPAPGAVRTSGRACAHRGARRPRPPRAASAIGS